MQGKWVDNKSGEMVFVQKVYEGKTIRITTMKGEERIMGMTAFQKRFSPAQDRK